MNAESGFLISLGQALAAMALYQDGHPARLRALDKSFERLLDVARHHSCVEYSFLGSETLAGSRVLDELARWEWAAKLAEARIERIEIDSDVTREAFVGFVEELFDQMSGRCVDTALMRQMVRSPIRFGRLKVRGSGDGVAAQARAAQAADAVVVNLTEEVAATSWIHEAVGRTGVVPMAEVESVVCSLAATMHQEDRMLMPLLTLKEYDQYTTTHACNVAVLSMGLAERLGLGPSEVRAVGIAGLLHDIGKVAIPHDLLVKPGRYTEAERQIIQNHPVEGAKLLLKKERGIGLAAVVAYEHHIYLNGEGYPELRFPRAAHYASRIVHVCDIYDALCTERPYRQAWEPDEALAYLQEQAGRELDPDMVTAFSDMIREALVQRVVVDAGQAPAVLDSQALPLVK